MQLSTHKNNVFDPIQFLGISGLNKEEESLLANQLEEKISEYIFIKLLQELPNTVDEELNNGKVQTIGELKYMLQ